LEDRSDGFCASETLHELVANVTHLEVGHHQYVGLAGHVALRSLLGGGRRVERRIGLQLTIHLQVGEFLFGNLRGFHHLIDDIHALAGLLVDGILGRSLGREAQHGHHGVLESGHALSRLRGGIGYLCQLVGGGVGCHGHVAHHHDTVFAVLLLVGEHQHGSAHAGNTRCALDDLQGGAQGIARGAERARYLSVGVAGLNDHTSQVEVVGGHQFTGLFFGHALLFAQLGELCGIFFGLVKMERIHDGGLVDVLQSPLGGLFPDIFGVADENELGKVVGKHFVGCL